MEKGKEIREEIKREREGGESKSSGREKVEEKLK